MPDDFQRRLPSVPRKISDIKPEDIRVSILGTVVDKKDDFVVIDDGSGKISVNSENADDLEPNQLVRIFGRIIPLEDGFEIQGEIIQDMNKLDVELWKKTKSSENLKS